MRRIESRILREDPPSRPQKLKVKLADGKARTIQHMMDCRVAAGHSRTKS